MANLAEILALRVRQARITREWTQEELAGRVGLSVRYIGQIERCRASPTVNVLGRIADAFGLEAGELLSRKPKAKPAK
jgi:transcriptional regulator with XRE-family HTH domain